MFLHLEILTNTEKGRVVQHRPLDQVIKVHMVLHREDTEMVETANAVLHLVKNSRKMREGNERHLTIGIKMVQDISDEVGLRAHLGGVEVAVVADHDHPLTVADVVDPEILIVVRHRIAAAIVVTNTTIEVHRNVLFHRHHRPNEIEREDIRPHRHTEDHRHQIRNQDQSMNCHRIIIFMVSRIIGYHQVPFLHHTCLVSYRQACPVIRAPCPVTCPGCP